MFVSTRPLCPDRHKRRELVTLLLRSLWRRLVKSSVPLKHRDFHQNDKVLASYHNIWKLDYRGLCGIVFSWEFISCFSTLVVSFKFGLCEKQWLSDNILSWWFCVFWGTRGVDEVLILWWFCRNLGVPADPPWRPHTACRRNVSLQFHFQRHEWKLQWKHCLGVLLRPPQTVPMLILVCGKLDIYPKFWPKVCSRVFLENDWWSKLWGDKE